MALCLLLAGAFFLAGCQRPGSDALVVGMDLSYPPFETIAENGHPSGVSVEIAEALGLALNRPVRVENIPFTGLIPSLQNGRVHCVISSMTDNPERRESIAFSDPYLTTGLALLVRAGADIQGAGDLDRSGRTVAVRQGTTGELWARQHLKQARVVTLEKEAAAVMEVMQGKSDAFIYDQMSVWQNARNHPELKALLEPIHRESWAIGLRKGDEEFRTKVNAFLAKFRAEGGFERLGDKYLQEQKDAFAKQGIPFVF